MTFDEFIQDDVDLIVSRAHFTDEQRKIFDLLLTSKYTDYGICRKINMSETRYYKIKKQVINKIKRIL